MKKTIFIQLFLITASLFMFSGCGIVKRDKGFKEPPTPFIDRLQDMPVHDIAVGVQGNDHVVA